MTQSEILVVEDEADILHLLYFNLSKEGFAVRTANDGKQALKEVKKALPSLILLDLMLPKLSGIDVCRELKGKKKTMKIPIIMLTAKGEESDIVKGLEAGADDYITKPFSPKVLIARIKAVLRRHQDDGSLESGEITQGDLTIFVNSYTVTLHKKPLNLTPMEYQFLLLLIRKPGWVFTRNQIVDGIRGEEYAVTERSVDVLVVGLRKKLRAADPLDSQYIETVRGVGYRFKQNKTQH